MAVWVHFGIQLGIRQTQALIITTPCTQTSEAQSALRAQSASLILVHGGDYNRCLCLQKTELNTKTNPNSHHFVAVWVRVCVQLDSLEKNLITLTEVTFTLK